MDPQVMIGDADVSRAASVRRRINNLIKQAAVSDFDLMDLLHEAKNKLYFQGWGFDSFSKYAKSLSESNGGFKYTKAYYLVAIKEVMTAAGLERSDFEPVGKTKLRMISELNKVIEDEFKDMPVKLLARELTLKAKEMTPDEVRLEVDTILGLTEDESFVWINIRVKKLAKENIILTAFRKAKRFMGQQKDEESGEFKDATDGSALEMICANFIADANFDVPEDTNENDSGTAETGVATADSQPETGEVEDPTEAVDQNEF
jgi:hypothetical protein